MTDPMENNPSEHAQPRARGSHGEAAESQRASDMPLPGGDFRMFVLKLNFQALIALGVLENPVTHETDCNLGHARMVIDDLRMLRDKTKGNLSTEETAQLAKVLSDLQFHFVRASDTSPDESEES